MSLSTGGLVILRREIQRPMMGSVFDFQDNWIYVLNPRTLLGIRKRKKWCSS